MDKKSRLMCRAAGSWAVGRGLSRQGLQCALTAHDKNRGALSERESHAWGCPEIWGVVQGDSAFSSDNGFLHPLTVLVPNTKIDVNIIFVIGMYIENLGWISM